MRTKYGPWTFSRKRLALTHRKRAYEINVEEWITSAEVLDWIFQIFGKPWCDDATIRGLLEAMDDLVYPQEYLCSFGHDKGPINVRKVSEEIERANKPFNPKTATESERSIHRILHSHK